MKDSALTLIIVIITAAYVDFYLRTNNTTIIFCDKYKFRLCFY